MNEERFSIECDEGECTIWYKKPKEAQYVIVMEIGYKKENTADEYYFTKDEAIAMAKRICTDLERATRPLVRSEPTNEGRGNYRN